MKKNATKVISMMLCALMCMVCIPACYVRAADQPFMTFNLKVSGNGDVVIEVVSPRVIEQYQFPKSELGGELRDLRMDTLGTVVFWFQNGRLDYWNYYIQKGKDLKLHNITDKCSGLLINNNYYTGYYIENDDMVYPNWSLNKMKKAIEEETVSEYVKYDHTFLIDEKRVALQDSNNKHISMYYFDPKTGKLKYDGQTFKKVKAVCFDSKGRLWFINKNGNLNKYIKKHKVAETYCVDAVKFQCNEKGIGECAITKDPTIKIKL